jgi:hypothetical protein
MSGALEGFRKRLTAMPVVDRIKWAETLAGRILDHTHLVLHLHASNRELNYSDRIGRQVPRSYAAHTFNLLRDTQHRYELLRLTALWDSPRDDRESIPTLIELIRDDVVQNELERRGAAQWAEPPVTNVSEEEHSPEMNAQILDMVRDSEIAFGREQATKGRRRLALASMAAARLQTSRQLKALKEFRHTHLAHNLGSGAANVTPQDRLRYGDERFVLRRTIAIVNWLNLGVRNSSFGWTEAGAIAQRYAAAFWQGVAIEVRE